MAFLIPGESVVAYLPEAFEDGAVSPTPAHWLRGRIDEVQPACRDFVRVTAAGVRHLVPAGCVRREEAV